MAQQQKPGPGKGQDNTNRPDQNRPDMNRPDMNRPGQGGQNDPNRGGQADYNRSGDVNRPGQDDTTRPGVGGDRERTDRPAEESDVDEEPRRDTKQNRDDETAGGE